MSGRWRIDPDRDRQARSSADRDRRGAAARAQRSAALRLGRPGADRRARRLAGVRGARARAARRELDGALAQAAVRRPRARRSSCCCSTSGSSPGLATSMSARRCSAPGSIRASAAGTVSLATARRAGRGDPGGARRSDRGGRVDACATSPPRRRAWLFLQELRRLRPRGRAVRGCGGTVRRIVQGGRSTFYCPRCQR